MALATLLLNGPESMTMDDTPIRWRLALAMPNRSARAEWREGFDGRADVAPSLATATLAELRAAAFDDADAALVDADAIDGDDEPFDAGEPRVVVLAEAGDERIGEWLIDGAAVLPRSASVDTIVAAIAALRAGLVATPPAYAAAALRYERLGSAGEPVSSPVPLTRREREVLERMSQGLRNREIGTALGISAHTAKFHVAQIIAKLDAQSRAHAVAKAMKAGWVEA